MADEPKQKFGFKDLRTAAELALAPGKPLSRSLPAVTNLKFDGKFGAIASAAALSGAAFASIRASLKAKQSLSTLQTSITNSLQGYTSQQASLIAGHTAIKDVAVFGLTSATAVQAGGFFSAADLTQISSVAAGTAIGASTQLAALLTQRRTSLSNLTSRISIALSAFSITNALIKENYNRTPYPLPEEVDRPSIPRLAQGDDAAQSDPVLKDKRAFVVKGAVAATGKPSTWSRLTTSVTDPLKGYRKQPGYNPTLNMVFADKKQQKAWSEPSTAYAAQFPYNKVTQTESGHIIEYDDTPGAERIHIFHRSGSFIEMHPDGKVVYKSMGHGFLVSMADQYVKVKGTCVISVDGDASIYAKGELNLQSDKDINVHTKQDFNVYATNVNVRAKKNATVDGLEVDLRYITLPGVPVVTPYGLAPRLNRAALKEDFPEIEQQVASQERQWDGQLNRLQSKVVTTLLPKVTSTSAAMTAPTGGGPVIGATAMAAAVVDQATTTLSMLTLLRGGAFPKGASPTFAFPELDPAQVPVESPLANPLAYIAKTTAAVNYRTFLLDTPEEMGDAEQYQAHLATRQMLGDIPRVEPQLGGKKTTPVSGIVAPASLPLVNYLDRDTYRGSFSADPTQPLGNTSFTYGDLVDALARPDVANPNMPMEQV